MSRDLGILFDIFQAVSDILEFTHGCTKAQFARNKLVLSALIQKLIVIGEATKRLSPHFRNTYPDIPWKLMAGMRERKSFMSIST